MKSRLSYLLKKSFRGAVDAPIQASRRGFIKKTVLSTVALSLPWATSCSTTKPSIAIIGGGIAGLTTSIGLANQGIEHTIYEASGRIGGRVLTVDDAVIAGAHVDFGAEFIDSIHTDLLALAKQLNVELVDLNLDKLIPKVYHFDGTLYSEEEIVAAIKPFAEKLAKDVSRIPEDIHYSKADQFVDLDQHSVTSYLQSIGMSGWLLTFFEMAMEGEYAMNASEQSAMNLLIMLSIPIEYEEHYHLFGNYHEVFKFKGGSQRLIDAMSKKVEGRVKLQHQLVAISKVNSRYKLSFKAGDKQVDVMADYVVLAMPHSVMRYIKRDFDFSERKEKWITEAGFGNAIKSAMGFNKKVWREAGYQGYTFTDINRTGFWDSAPLVNTEAGSLTFAAGGDPAKEMANLSYDEIKEKWLKGADSIFPGLMASHNGKISKFPWIINPFSKGSYTAYKKGQWSEFAGVEAEPFENILFAGENCSIQHQGFMNGAVETGNQAAHEIIQRLSINQ